jgi:phosphoglycolate phosphatase
MRIARGRKPLPFAELRPVASHGARGLLSVAFGVTPADREFEELRQEFFREYEGALCVDSLLFPTMDEALSALEAAGIRWGIVTNKAARFTQPLIDLLPPLHRAGTVVSGDTTAHAKPHPAPLLHAAAELGIAAERCLYVGDALRDVEAGNAAGMVSIVAVYGYIEPHEAPDEWPAAGMIDRPGALLDWLPPAR